MGHVYLVEAVINTDGRHMLIINHNNISEFMLLAIWLMMLGPTIKDMHTQWDNSKATIAVAGTNHKLY